MFVRHSLQDASANRRAIELPVVHHRAAMIIVVKGLLIWTRASTLVRPLSRAANANLRGTLVVLLKVAATITVVARLKFTLTVHSVGTWNWFADCQFLPRQESCVYPCNANSCNSTLL